MSKHVIIAWSPEEYEALARLAAEGLTAAEIMRALNADYGGGRTRNAILGAAHRVGVKVGKPNKGVITSALKRKGKGEGRLRDRFKEKLRGRKRKEKKGMPHELQKIAADLFVIDRGLRPEGAALRRAGSDPQNLPLDRRRPAGRAARLAATSPRWRASPTASSIPSGPGGQAIAGEWRSDDAI